MTNTFEKGKESEDEDSQGEHSKRGTDEEENS